MKVGLVRFCAEREVINFESIFMGWVSSALIYSRFIILSMVVLPPKENLLKSKLAGVVEACGGENRCFAVPPSILF